MLDALPIFGLIFGGAVLAPAGAANDLVREAAVGTGGRQLGSSSEDESESLAGGAVVFVGAAAAADFGGIMEGFLAAVFGGIMEGFLAAGSGFLGSSTSTFADIATTDGSDADGRVATSSLG